MNSAQFLAHRGLKVTTSGGCVPGSEIFVLRAVSEHHPCSNGQGGGMGAWSGRSCPGSLWNWWKMKRCWSRWGPEANGCTVRCGLGEDGGDLGAVDAQEGFWDPELSVEVSGLPLLVGVCQHEWSHGSFIASPERFSIDFHCSSREGCHRVGKQHETNGFGRGRKKLPLLL